MLKIGRHLNPRPLKKALMAGRPILVQASESPIVIREGEKLSPLLCEGCHESILIENYVADCFVGIGLMCFKCQHVTITPSLPKGEIFTNKPRSLGRTERYFIVSSLVHNKDVVMTCDQEIEKASRLTDPKKIKGVGLDFSLEGLDSVSSELNVLTFGRFNKSIQSAKRSIDRKNPYYRKNPLAWSIEILRKQLEVGELIRDKQTHVALGLLHTYCELIERWKEHVHFPTIVNELYAYFYHTLILLIATSHLRDSGNRIAINVSGEGGERTADLYIRTSGSESLFFEVKCPEALEWTKSQLTLKGIRKVVEKCLSKSRGQIDTDKPGILVIGATCLDKGFLNNFKNQVKEVLKAKGQSYSAIAGILIVGLMEVSLNDGLSISTSFYTSLVKNINYFKADPIEVSI